MLWLLVFLANLKEELTGQNLYMSLRVLCAAVLAVVELLLNPSWATRMR